MPGFDVIASVVPTGGAILLSITSLGSAGFDGIVINRNANGGSFTNIYSGGPTSLFLDVGETLNTALDTSATYSYQVQDMLTPSVSALVPGIIPSCQLTLIQDITTEHLRRLMQSGFDSLVLPAGFKSPQFLVQMPLSAVPTLPFVTMNLDLTQQEEVPIGLGIPLENFSAEAISPSGSTAVWTVQGLQNRRYSYHILTRTYQERDYFESALIGILYGLQSMFTKANLNVRFRFQATQGAVEGDEGQPGFYYSQIMMDITSVAMTQISALIGVIKNLNINASTSATIAGTGLTVQT